MEEFFTQVGQALVRVNLNQSVTQTLKNGQPDVKAIEHDFEILERAKKLLALACKKHDEDLQTARQIKGTDFLKSVKFHRKPREASKSDPLTKMLTELSS